MSKLKEVFCYDTSPVGKLSEWLVKVYKSAEITAGAVPYGVASL